MLKNVKMELVTHIKMYNYGTKYVGPSTVFLNA